jgi:PqqD family protein of HPr-rel-A system
MPGPRYIADPKPLVRTLELDGLSALFHRRSGTTHILAAPAPQILEVLAERAGDRDEILERMAERFELEAEDAAASIEARLAELEAAGLVRLA